MLIYDFICTGLYSLSNFIHKEESQMKKQKVKIRITSDYVPSPDAPTEVCISNHIKELRVVEKCSHSLNRFRRLKGNQYLDTETGEVREYQNHSTQKHFKRKLNKMFETLRQLINANFTSGINELHVILTYAEKMEDIDKVSKDFKRFWEKLHYHYPDLEFIRILEPQHTGTWHIHVLLKTNCYQKLEIPKQVVETLWGHGFVRVVKIRDNDNIGAYFSAHQKDVNAFDAESEEQTDRKCIIKGARLQFYPPNKRIYSYSKGIEKPKKIRTTFSEALQLVDVEHLVFSSSMEITVTDTETGSETIVNQIGRFQFNSKRTRKDEV